MAKITRQTFLQFGVSGPSADFAQFGSEAASAPVTSKSIPTIQGLTAWLDGWQDAVLANDAPALEDMNGVLFVFSYMLAYMLQEGIPEYDSGTTYYKGSIVMNTVTTPAIASEVYMSLTDSNSGNALPSRVDNSNWQYCGLAQTPANLSSYRRPNMMWDDSTHVHIESGLDGTSGDVIVNYGDGEKRITNSLTLTKASTGTVAVLSGGGKTAGIRTGSVPTNAWGHCYSVKATDTADNILVIDFTNDFIPANKATFDGYWGVNGWVYLGKIRVGDQGSTSSGVLNFVQNGNKTWFINTATAASFSNGIIPGILLVGSVGSTAISWSYASGISGAVIPASITVGIFSAYAQGGGTIAFLKSGGLGNRQYAVADVATGSVPFMARWEAPIVEGASGAQNASSEINITLAGFIDGALSANSLF